MGSKTIVGGPGDMLVRGEFALAGPPLMDHIVRPACVPVLDITAAANYVSPEPSGRGGEGFNEVETELIRLMKLSTDREAAANTAYTIVREHLEAIGAPADTQSIQDFINYTYTAYMQQDEAVPAGAGAGAPHGGLDDRDDYVHGHSDEDMLLPQWVERGVVTIQRRWRRHVYHNYLM